MGDLNGTAAGRREATIARVPRSTGKRARVIVGPAIDPLSKVLADGPRLPVAVTVALTILLHVGFAAGGTAAALLSELFAWQRNLRELVDYRLSQYEMDIVKEAPPPEPEPPKPEPEPEPEKPVVKDTTPPPEAPPQPAQAAKILAAEPTPNETVDLRDAIITGSGDTYAGGQTTEKGTSKIAVYNPAAAPTGVPGGIGTAPAPAVRREDKTRVPGLLGSVDWNDCPFPGEADAEQIDQAYVMIQVKVKPDGSPENVTVVQDPGHGFGREARKCAMRKKYSQGLDADGNSVGGMTKPFRVRFER
ncbi:MAG TPA: energy transducer TonB [Labilithrix sp.]|nr:energy transducer TonB [Labilithrix sp.]